MLIEGTPKALVTKIPLFAFAIEAKLFAVVVYNKVLIPPNVVNPVPPLATTNVPPNVIAPLVVVGVNPVEPPLNVVTPLAAVNTVLS